jgi:hypothetical protein
MNERLRFLILDDVKQGPWEDFLRDQQYQPYLDCRVFNLLEDALEYLDKNFTTIHAVLSDFKLDGGSNHVTRLGGTTFDQYVTRAMGANLTLLAEWRRREPGCSILVNKLYTVAEQFLKTHSLESHLLFKFYIQGQGLLHPIGRTELIDEDMAALLREALDEVRRVMFQQSETADGLLGKLHRLLYHKLARYGRLSNSKEEGAAEAAKKLQEDLYGPDWIPAPYKVTFRDAVKALLGERLRVIRNGSEIDLPLAALCPRLHYEFDEYLKYYAGVWADDTLRKFHRLLSELEALQKYCRDHTQRLGMFLQQSDVMKMLHNFGFRLGDIDHVIAEAEREPFSQVSGLREILAELKRHQAQIESEEKEWARFVDLFYHGTVSNPTGAGWEAAAAPPAPPAALAGEGEGLADGGAGAANWEPPFMGFRVESRILDDLVGVLNSRFKSLTIEKDPSRTYVGPRGTDYGIRDRIFTDKRRLCKAVKFILDEAARKGYGGERGRISLSYCYDEARHCAKLIVEDFGVGMSQNILNNLGNGLTDKGGWAGALHELRGWVEDVWVISNDGSSGEARRAFNDDRAGGRERINEHKDGTGTKVVILYNFVSEVNP